MDIDERNSSNQNYFYFSRKNEKILAPFFQKLDWAGWCGCLRHLKILKKLIVSAMQGSFSSFVRLHFLPEPCALAVRLFPSFCSSADFFLASFNLHSWTMVEQTLQVTDLPGRKQQLITLDYCLP